MVYKSVSQSSNYHDTCFNFKLPSRFDKRKTKQQAKDLGNFGQRLFELLGKETDSKFNRNKALKILNKILKGISTKLDDLFRFTYNKENTLVNLIRHLLNNRI